MGSYLSERELEQLSPAETAAFSSPIPTQMVSNGEFNPLPQTADQRKVEGRLKAFADRTGAGSSWIGGSSYVPTRYGRGIFAMNDVFGPTVQG